LSVSLTEFSVAALEKPRFAEHNLELATQKRDAYHNCLCDPVHEFHAFTAFARNCASNLLKTSLFAQSGPSQERDVLPEMNI